MSEKIYQLNADQIGVVKFEEPWFLIHIALEDESKPLQFFFSSLTEGIRKFASLFEKHIINVWSLEGLEGQRKIRDLKNYVLTTWWNPGVETMRESLFQQYGDLEFKKKTGKELIENGYDFLASTIAHICLRFNKMHFYFEGLHISTRTVDKFLAVNFWSKIKSETLEDAGTT